MSKFPFVRQRDSMQCGIACLQMICAHYGKKYSQDFLSNICYATTEGVSLLGIKDAAAKIGFYTISGRLTIDELSSATLPCILHWNQNHFVVLYKVKKGSKFYIADPGKGLISYTIGEFKQHWIEVGQGESEKGIAMFLEPTQAFYDNTNEHETRIEKPFKFLFGYVKQYRKYFFQIILGLFVGSLLQLALPFLTQSIVDIGIKNKDISFIWLILIGQLVITLSRTSVDFIRRWLLLHISMRINISLVSDFFIKLLQLPMSFFDTKLMGDLMQRIGDHSRVNSFLTQQTLNVAFSLISFAVFSCVLLVYNRIIFFIFLIGSILYGGWMALFLRRRKVLKNIIITVVSATAVINGSLTLGMMLAVQYIIGQLNSPIEQLIHFIYSVQDVKISLERINEIHKKDNEEDYNRSRTEFDNESHDIELRNIDFKYDPHALAKTIEGVNIHIPEGKITAIVGASGSGKTTLIKLMLGYYPVMSGEITIAGHNISEYNLKWWRQQCGVVMQDGVIFSESIARNIAVDDGEIDEEKLEMAAEIANVKDFVMALPLKFNTNIGRDGMGLSQGQKQRILIARAVYKNPKFIFLDEATNSLDASNERAIVENLDKFYKGKTVVVVAHRLSTVKNADQIIVLDKGKVVETGNHKSLTAKRGAYYKLVKNQLELGN